MGGKISRLAEGLTPLLTDPVMELPEQNVSSFAARYWNYSLTAYAQAGVQTLCLQLQRDYQANVNLLLLGGFLGSLGLVHVAEDWVNLEAALAPVNRRCTQRIRQLRAGAKKFAGLHPHANECYRQLKALELQAERIEQLIVVGSCDNQAKAHRLHSQNCAIDEQILHNLLGYYATWPTKCPAAAEAVRALAAALLQNGGIKGNLSPL